MNIKKIALMLVSPFISLAINASEGAPGAASKKASYMSMLSSTHWMYIGVALVLVALVAVLVWVKRKNK